MYYKNKQFHSVILSEAEGGVECILLDFIPNKIFRLHSLALISLKMTTEDITLICVFARNAFDKCAAVNYSYYKINLR